MSYDEFIALVEEMRSAQKAYFRERDYPAKADLLEKSKDLERRVDKAISNRHQGGLFDG